MANFPFQRLQADLATLIAKSKAGERLPSEPTLAKELVRADQVGTNFKGSVLDFLRERGDPLTVSKAVISAIGAPADVAKTLQIQRGDVLLEFISKLYNPSGEVLDYSFSYFIPGHFHFHVVRRVGE